MAKALYHYVRFFRVVWLIIFCMMISCKGTTTSLYVLFGNYLYDQGRYQESVIYYFKALKKTKNAQIIYYNLGTSYYALGESESAIRMWSDLPLDSSDKLKGMATFNTGVAYYQLGKYDESVRNFHRAMQYLPDNFEIKVNLELALNKRNKVLNGEDETSQSEAKISNQDKQITIRTLDYLHRRNLYFRSSLPGEEVWKQEENDW